MKNFKTEAMIANDFATLSANLTPEITQIFWKKEQSELVSEFQLIQINDLKNVAKYKVICISKTEIV